MLTKKQQKILDYIKKYIKRNNYSPSLQEIAKRFKLSSISGVHQHVEALKTKGYLNKFENHPRTIQISNKFKRLNFVKIPILGVITAGQPIEAMETLGETINISKNEISPYFDYYALKVNGDSMIEEGIFDGDTVIIKKQSTAENGQTVVAIINQNEATLKKIYRLKDAFKLQPANQNMLPIYTNEIEIRGVLVKTIHNNQEQKTFKTLDLFAGIGGIRFGFEKNGFETVFANDFDENCKRTYDLNFKTSKLITEDITKIGINDLPKFDFLLAGFPCQAFSIAGYRQGFKDEKGRGNLFFDIARIIEAKKPQGFLLENVKNLISHDNGKTFKIIIQTLENFGYHVKYKILNSMNYGNIPQNRERIYIVGFKNKNHADKFNFPEPIKLETKINDFLEENVDNKYYYNDKPLYKKLKNSIREENKIYQWRRQYVRENKKNVCPTLTANMGTGGHNVPIIKDKKGIRKLTPLECFRLQGFSKDFILPKNLADSILYKQAGNSVTVPVIERIAGNIKKAITN